MATTKVAVTPIKVAQIPGAHQGAGLWCLP